MAYNAQLAERLRQTLAHIPGVTEKKMFGGTSFIVNGKLAVGANYKGGLLVRCDPAKLNDTKKGAHNAEMGNGRQMSKGWVSVDAAAVQNDDDLAVWIQLALDYNKQLTQKVPPYEWF